MSDLCETKIFSIGSINIDVYNLDQTKKLYLGGSILNTAYFLQNLFENQTAKILPVAVIGNDTFSEIILNKMKEKGFNTSYIKTIDGYSSKTDVFLNEFGEREIKHYPSVNSMLFQYIKDIIRPILDSNTIIHMKGDFKLVQKIFEITDSIFSADISGFLGSNDIIFNKRIVDNKKIRILLGNTQEYEKCAEILGLIDYRDENNDLTTNSTYFSKLKDIFQSECIFIKEGAQGASVFYDDKFFHIDASKVNVVDTTGAGDAFNAGVIYAICGGI